MTCRLHGPRCSTPWGYDRAHTDSPRPYTPDELAARYACGNPPHRYAYASTADYVQGWELWRAIGRDGRLNPDEGQAWLEGLEAELLRRQALERARP